MSILDNIYKEKLLSNRLQKTQCYLGTSVSPYEDDERQASL